VVDRRKFDRFLAEQARVQGASFLLGTRVEAVEITHDHATLHGHCQGEPVSFEASLVVVATGADEALSQFVGVSHSQGQSMFGAQLFVETNTLEEVEVHVGRAIAPGGFAWAVPANGSGSRVGLVAQGRPAERLRRFAKALEERGAIHRNGATMRCHAVPAGPRRPSYGDRIMVVGDAAGQVKATTSGGIFYGLLGAHAAVRQADLALRKGDTSAGQLARYEERWLGEIGPELRLGRMLRRLYCSLNDRDFEALFWLARRAKMPRALRYLEFDWHSAGLLATLWRMLLSPVGLGAGEVAIACQND
jgi:flavin-dependent dehydrogenase